ncbi:hypothetical protein [Gilvimarinus polysaccharolyticus]|uniref:hypothetical protein n=1 Tax=Gilvimarinus polysaccharolyticus TaxID=863921 RepID=UPI000673A1BE|nr:hypothetical protein [Gilvimarinus polysaccharolyticus]
MAISPTFKIGYFTVVEFHKDGEYRIRVADARTGEKVTFNALSLPDYDQLLSELESDPSTGCLTSLAETFREAVNG